MRCRLCVGVNVYDGRLSEKGRGKRTAGAVITSFPLGGKRRKDIVNVERILVTSSSLSVVVEALATRLPVLDLSFSKDAGLIPLVSYFSELDDENTADSLWDGGV